ncbi:EAL domain-containing protein [Thermosipho ferrireducens]|uniref:EAL domain-containing protein n=1 Tax=Thermosipho ferrireducens TaxID=2571116 RepID=A0ABX7S9R5_9BACT|nr:EAL domain-containing protein [Thermosipho ferrireducens]QTA38131.1 EAL domain-containing protein [Thermosipho ferrireducens]
MWKWNKEEKQALRNITNVLFNKDNIEKLKVINTIFKKSTILALVIKSFLRNETWIDYLLHSLDPYKIKERFQKELSNYFYPIVTTVTDSLDFISIVVLQHDISNEKSIERQIELFEEKIISFFLSDDYLGQIKQHFKAFRNPFEDFFGFSVGYAVVNSPNDESVINALKIAIKNAEVRKKLKLNKLTMEFFEILNRNKLESHFQPIVDIKDKKIYAYEALVRGPEESKLRNPSLLFKIASLNDLEFELDNLTRKIHLYNFKTILKENKKAKLSINLGPSALLFADRVVKDFKNNGISGDQVICEISESTFIEDFSAFFNAIEFLNSEGYMVALDDFGAGGATFKIILSENVSIVKIDRSLSRAIEFSRPNTFFLRELLPIMQNSNKAVIIEGIETEDQLKLLLDMGYRYYQGFYFAKPSSKPVDIKFMTEKFGKQITN